MAVGTTVAAWPVSADALRALGSTQIIGRCYGTPRSIGRSRRGGYGPWPAGGPRSRSAAGWWSVFAVFILILLFAGWFLDPGSLDPARLYLGFVLTTTSYLVLLLVLFFSAFSLPADIKNRTLHTVVTKPVRASEIVLGRILGFAVGRHAAAGRDGRDQLRVRRCGG